MLTGRAREDGGVQRLAQEGSEGCAEHRGRCVGDGDVSSIGGLSVETSNGGRVLDGLMMVLVRCEVLRSWRGEVHGSWRLRWTFCTFGLLRDMNLHHSAFT